MRDHHLNLFCEVMSLGLFFGSLAVLGFMAAFSAGIVAIEADLEETPWVKYPKFEGAATAAHSYLGLVFILLAPAVVLFFAVVGIRLLLVRPEPPPWGCPDEDITLPQ